MNAVCVTTYANIALIKYWGKRDTELMLPTKSSISVGLAALETNTTLRFIAHNEDVIEIDGCTDVHLLEPVHIFLNTLRKTFSINKRFSIVTKNQFPTASGLASSASGFAALALGLNSLCNLHLSTQEISVLARRGSGSAARSIYEGFVVWHRGTAADGSDSFAEQLAPASSWPAFRVLIIETTTAAKKISSRTGMQTSVTSSPLYSTWIRASEDRIERLKQAILSQDFSTVGKLAEADWEGMREVMLSTVPPLPYWNEASLTVINEVKKLRADGIECYLTTDAGPHVKIFCLASSVAVIKKNLEPLPGVLKIIESGVAPAPRVELQEC